MTRVIIIVVIDGDGMEGMKRRKGCEDRGQPNNRKKKEEEERCDKIIGSNNRWRERGWSWAVQRFFLSAEP